MDTFILVAILKIIKPFSMKLQGVSRDLHYIMEGVHDCMTALNGMRAREFVNKAIF